MTELTVEEKAERLDGIDGVTAWESHNGNLGSVFARVTDEDSVGAFFARCRELGVEPDIFNRDTVENAVIGGWLEA